MRALPLIFLLSACATTGANVTGNAMSVTVNNVWNQNQAFGVAEEHCAGYGKVARANERSGEFAWSFDCVSAE